MIPISVKINDEVFIFTQKNLEETGYGKRIRLGGKKFYFFANVDEAGDVVKEYWEDLALNDPEEFVSIVGYDRVIQWARSGIGYDTWLENTGNTPEDFWGNYDHRSYTLSFSFPRRLDMSQSENIEDYLREICGFVPTIAYRTE